MENVAKALKDLQKALENNPNVKTVKITITLQKPTSKPSKN
ncbi:MAG: tetratricopeptide repeat protein [Oscillospiraceae bacterium]|nr:tetratricopeptide repeat protein [Oscillospiraceae bacterium]MBR6983018.1 tetratricopeptide repeat protein [Ruminococcus sp.]